jgi:hypothetical protein
MTKNITKQADFVFRIAFLLVYITSLFIPLQAISAAPVAVQQKTVASEIILDQPASSVAAPGPEPAKGGYTIHPQKLFTNSDTAMFSSGPVNVHGSSVEKNINPFSGLFAPLASAPSSTNTHSDWASGLKITPIAAYNVIVDSNVLAPSSYGPNAATLGAQYCNTTAAAITGVWAHIGNHSANTPGVYPVITPATAATNTGNSALSSATTSDDGGSAAAGSMFSLKHQSGSAGGMDASRYIGDIPAGECRTQYWLISYPRKFCTNGVACDLSNTTRDDVTGGVKPEDDLWLQYDFWGNKAGGATEYYTRYLTMRNEISAMANKIWPNGDNKVPEEYVSAIAQVLGWDTLTPSGGATAYPGETVTSQGIWYDFGNVGAGFDNNYDLVPDRNAWVQPIGDVSAYDPGCFRLVRTYGLVIVKINDGTELLIPFVDQM